VLEAELWGIFYDLKMAWERGFQKVKIYNDSMIVIKLLKDGVLLTHLRRTYFCGLDSCYDME
jgi:ribonuclease HI